MALARFVWPVLAVAVGASAPAAAAEPKAVYTVERVVMLMRHGVRPPTKFPATPAGTTKQPWSTWTTPAGDLTPHGAEGVARLGSYDRGLFAGQGLIPARGCAPAGTIVASSSGSSRAIKTAQAFLDALQPGCATPFTHPASEEAPDPFHAEADVTGIDGDRALAAAEATLPPGGLAAEVAAHAAEFALLDRVTGVPVDRASTLGASPGDKPDLKGGLSFGSTVAQTLLLEYLDGKPIGEVGWGRASPADIRQMLRFHPLKFRYETRAPYVARRLAAPLVRQMMTGVEQGPKLTLLFGHDTNIAALGGFYDLHWQMADYPEDDIAPGGAIGFEVVRDRSGRRFVRAFVQAQTMAELRGLDMLTGASVRRFIAIPGCAGACPLETFLALTRERLRG